MNVSSVLCVCTGNICRSPYAEGLLRRDLPDVRVSSAGTGAVVGGEMPPLAARIARRQLLDLANHRGRQITRRILLEHDLVLVMESGQKQWVGANFPEGRGRVFLLSHWGDKTDVPDPFQQSEQFFGEVFARVADYVADWRDKLAKSRPPR